MGIMIAGIKRRRVFYACGSARLSRLDSIQCERRIENVGHQHVAGLVGDRKRQARFADGGLRCDPAGPEHRDLILADGDGIAVVGLR